MRTNIRARVGLLLAAGLLAGGCAYRPELKPHQGLFSDDFNKAGETLERLQWYADAYGNASISSPLFVRPDKTFEFKLDKIGPNEFFNAARDDTDVRYGGLTDVEIKGGLDLEVQADIATFMKYQSNMAAYQQKTAALADKRRLLNEAALLRYKAAKDDAHKIRDPGARNKALADAKEKYANELALPEVEYPKAEGDPPALNGAKDEKPGEAKPMQRLFAGAAQLKAPMRSSLLLAAGDTATYAMLSLLGDASKMTSYKGKRVLFGASMVSVSPGWKTQKGFSADLSVRLEFVPKLARVEVRDAFLAKKGETPQDKTALEQLQSCVVKSLPQSVTDVELREALERTPAYPEMRRAVRECRDQANCDESMANVRKDQDKKREEERKKREQGTLGQRTPAPQWDLEAIQFRPYRYRPDYSARPLVAAVSPMNEAQSLDLQASYRHQASFALRIAAALSYAGLGAQANIFFNFAKTRQKEAETRSNHVIVSSYSNAGGVFGFRMNPSLTANPDGGEDVMRQVMRPWSFPTLLIVGADDEHLKPRVAVIERDDGPLCVVVEPSIELLETARWVPLEDPCWRGEWSHCRGGESLSENERFLMKGELLRDVLDPMDVILTKPLAKEAWPMRSTAAFMRQKGEILNALLSGATYSILLPVELLKPVPPPEPSSPPVIPVIAATSPNQINLATADDGAWTPKSETLMITGNDLDKVDLQNIALAAGIGALGEVKLVGKTIHVAITVKGDEPIVLKLPVKDQPVMLYSSLVKVSGHELAIQSNNGKNREMIKYSRGVPSDVVKSYIEKNKPAPVK